MSILVVSRGFLVDRSNDRRFAALESRIQVAEEDIRKLKRLVAGPSFPQG